MVESNTMSSLSQVKVQQKCFSQIDNRSQQHKQFLIACNDYESVNDFMIFYSQCPSKLLKELSAVIFTPSFVFRFFRKGFNKFIEMVCIITIWQVPEPI